MSAIGDRSLAGFAKVKESLATRRFERSQEHRRCAERYIWLYERCGVMPFFMLQAETQTSERPAPAAVLAKAGCAHAVERSEVPSRLAQPPLRIALTFLLPGPRPLPSLVMKLLEGIFLVNLDVPVVESGLADAQGSGQQGTAPGEDAGDGVTLGMGREGLGQVWQAQVGRFDSRAAGLKL
jgi:hypothetical protein